MKTPTTYCETISKIIEKTLIDYTSLINHHSFIYYDPLQTNVAYPPPKLYCIDLRNEEAIESQNQIANDFKSSTKRFEQFLIDCGEGLIDRDSINSIFKLLSERRTDSKNKSDQINKIQNEIKKIQKVITSLRTSQSDIPIIIPDTNALITHHELVKWTFDGLKNFTILLIPTVVGEIGKIKIEHRNENVRKKAKSIDRQLKEFRSRGSLLDGVDLVTGKSSLQAIAVEPNFEKAPSWLDCNNNDDRILARIMEITKMYPHTPIYAVSFDVNFQTKAEYLGIPFLEPDVIANPNPIR